MAEYWVRQFLLNNILAGMNIFLYIFFFCLGGELLKEEDEKIYRFPAVQIICVDVGIYENNLKDDCGCRALSNVAVYDGLSFCCLK